jgi:hypothetical protein
MKPSSVLCHAIRRACNTIYDFYLPRLKTESWLGLCPFFITEPERRGVTSRRDSQKCKAKRLNELSCSRTLMSDRDKRENVIKGGATRENRGSRVMEVGCRVTTTKSEFSLVKLFPSLSLRFQATKWFRLIIALGRG